MPKTTSNCPLVEYTPHGHVFLASCGCHDGKLNHLRVNNPTSLITVSFVHVYSRRLFHALVTIANVAVSCQIFEYCSIAYFDRITAFITHTVCLNFINRCNYALCMSPNLNGRLEIQHCEIRDTIEIRNSEIVLRTALTYVLW